MSETDLSVSSNATSAVIALTKGELWFQLIIAYGIIGSISAIMHTLIAISVFRVERLHNRFYVFIFFISIARVLYACTHVMLCVYRSLRTMELVDMNIVSLLCHTIHIFT